MKSSGVTNFCINPLSVNEQCDTQRDLLNVLSGLVECFKYIRPALSAERARLLYDPRLGNRSIIRSQNIDASVGSLCREGDGADLRTQWYLYTKNRAKECSWDDDVNVEVSCTKCPCEPVNGDISKELNNQDVFWLSFGGTKLNEDSQLIVNSDENIFEIDNAHNREALRTKLPLFESSDKHTKKPYFDQQRNEHVAAMPLSDNEAQRLLLESVEEGTDRWAYHKVSNKFYRFKLTHNDRNIYHGFEVEDREVPQSVHKKL